MAVEQLVYDTVRVGVGAFRCPPSRPDFRTAGAIGDHCVFAFPRTAVRIRHDGGPQFTADPAVVTYYNPRQPFTRAPLDPAGDLCEWFALDTALAAEVVREHDPSAAERPQAPFRFSHGPSDAATYLAQRALFLLLARGGAEDALGVEEAVLTLLDRLLGLAHESRPSGPPAPGRREREAARQARDLLSYRYREALTLGDLARAVSLSRFRLCRAFRHVAGTTMHAFREQLRLRAALAPLADGGTGLTELALDLGYSSHSHFTASFRRAFGLTPSRARARLAASSPP